MKNIGIITLATALALACSTATLAATDTAKTGSGQAATKSESAGEYVDDSVITGKVKAAILGDSSLKSAEINVETYKGIVQLSGFVGSAAGIKKAVRHAHKVQGVQSVKNDMIVKGKQ